LVALNFDCSLTGSVPLGALEQPAPLLRLCCCFWIASYNSNSNQQKKLNSKVLQQKQGS
jgi:hypothetical protein